MDLTTVVAFGATGIIAAGAAIFKQSIIDTWQDWKFYKTRFLDSDGNPDSPDVGQMHNGGNGEWGVIIVDRYDFCWLSSAKRTVSFRHVSLDGTTKPRCIPLKAFRTAAVAKPDRVVSANDKVLLANKGIACRQALPESPPVEAIVTGLAREVITELKNAATSANSAGAFVGHNTRAIKANTEAISADSKARVDTGNIMAEAVMKKCACKKEPSVEPE